MTREDKQLLLVDLCARLPYGVKGYLSGLDIRIEILGINGNDIFCKPLGHEQRLTRDIRYVKPYLRPLSSLTEEEQEILDDFGVTISPFSGQILVPFNEITFPFITMQKIINYLYSIHIDINGLIPKDLAISTEVFNPYKD